MSAANPPSDSGTDEGLTDDELDQRIFDEHRSIPQDVRERALNRDACRCRIDGRRGTGDGDAPHLVVQRLQDHPRDCQPNALENVTTRCLRCARWIEQMPNRDDLPPVLQERLDGADLKTTRVQILQYLYRSGPASTSEIAENVDLANATSVRRALYDLMSCDVSNDDVDRLLVKDRVNGTYGLPWQIPDDRHARGVIPLEPHRRRSRILDAVVHRLLTTVDGAVEQPRALVAEVVDRDLNQTYHMERRAQAFQFPFEEWAETKRSRHDDAAAIEAISILAGATGNVSRRQVANALVEVFEHNDEHELATVLRQSLLENTDPPFDALAGQSTGRPSSDQPLGEQCADQSTGEQSANTASTEEATPERTELQVFDDPDASARAGHTNGDSSQGRPHSEDHHL